MTRFICTMLTMLSILANICAQPQINASIGKTFSASTDHMERRFWIDLGKGNRLCLELEDHHDLEKFTNIDSLLMVFLADMKPFSDSLSDPLSWHLIDYTTDVAGKKKVRFQTFRPTASSFLLDQSEPTALRIEQDTLRITIEFAATTGRRHDGIRQDRLSLYLNNYHEISSYVTGGLNEKVRWLQTNMNKYWVHDKNVYRAEKDPTISAPQPAGYVAMLNDYLGTIVQVNVGNYKNYFAPSFSLGLGVHYLREESARIFSVLWQPVFLFGTNAQGHTQTYRNDFLTFSFSRSWNNKNIPHVVNLEPAVSIGWLIHREGDLFDKNTRKVFVGHLDLFRGAIILQPGMYFNDFFKAVTPALTLNVDL